MAKCFRISFVLIFVGLAIGTPCPAISNTTFQLADVLVEWEANTNIQHGIEFEDVNGDGLADMIYGWDDGSNVYITCVYLNTGYSWVQQGSEADIGCAATTFIRVRDTHISFKKHSVGQLRQTVAVEFGLRTEDVAVLGRGGVKFGQTTQLEVSDLFPKGFEVHVRDSGSAGNRDVVPDVYSCPEYTT